MERDVSDKFGLPAPTLLSYVGRSPPLAFSRLTCSAPNQLASRVTRAEDAYAISVFLGSAPVTLQMKIDGRDYPQQIVGQGGVVLTHLESRPSVRLDSGFDFIRCYIAKATLDEMADCVHGKGADGLRRPEFGDPDPLLFHLAASAAPLLRRAAPADQLLLDQLAMAFLSRISVAYGGAPRDRRVIRGGLTPKQERRAKDYIEANLDVGVTLAQVARQCDVSPSHFSRAFRNSTGRPPHRWLLERRVEAAKVALAKPDIALSDIATGCGFCDPSHFSRVFSKMTGQTPADWRRSHSGYTPGKSGPPLRSDARSGWGAAVQAR